MKLTDAYLVGSYTEFLVLLPYLAKVHEEKGLILMRERALGEIKRILDSNRILEDVVDEITDLMTEIGEHPERLPKLRLKDVLELGETASRWRSKISQALESIKRS